MCLIHHPFFLAATAGSSCSIIRTRNWHLGPSSRASLSDAQKWHRVDEQSAMLLGTAILSTPKFCPSEPPQDLEPGGARYRIFGLIGHVSAQQHIKSFDVPFSNQTQNTTPQKYLFEMCLYYTYTVKLDGCKADPKHLIERTRDIPCDKVTKEKQPMCQPVERIPWQFGSSTVAGACVKCGKDPTQPSYPNTDVSLSSLTS